MKKRFFNRELSWLEFNARVLHEALKKNLPLMERINFLSIASNNFNEFFQVRVASVKRLAITNPHNRDASNVLPKTLLRQISVRAHELIGVQHDCLMNDIIPSLAEAHLVYVTRKEFSVRQKEYAANFFRQEIFPLLTPLRAGTKEFPHISNGKLHAAFLLEQISGIRSEVYDFAGEGDESSIALLPVPEMLEGIVWLPSGMGSARQFTLLTDVIAEFATSLFPGYTVRETLFFKIMRDADLSVDEESSSNFIHAMEDIIVQRQSSFVVSLFCTDTSVAIRSFLKKKLLLQNQDVYTVKGILEPAVLNVLRFTDEGDFFTNKKWKHFYPVSLKDGETFWDSLKSRDVLLHVPYESYEPVVKFISDAASDKNVLAIKMTLYRTDIDSPIITALAKAAHRGKQVTVLVELKARFDEERNIAWASHLERAGVIVIYGLVKLKVHAKILMVIRREDDTLRRYVHLSTGNYNHRTATVYSDMSLFTTNTDIAQDATSFFNLITGYSALQTMRYISISPISMKNKIIEFINSEINFAKSGGRGLIIAKMNSLTHEEIIEHLYKASCAGVKILLNVRGVCTLVPGVKNMSENIRVVSIVDRYLEHARIFYFQNGDSPHLYLSSADWMPRNLDRRVELMFPILEKYIFDEVKYVLDTYFIDSTNSHELTESGAWVERENEGEPKRAQEILYEYYKHREIENLQVAKAAFEVRRK